MLLVVLSVALFSLVYLTTYHISLVQSSVVSPLAPKWPSGRFGATSPPSSLALVSFVYFSDAIETVRKEQEELQAELEAFGMLLEEIDGTTAVKQSQRPLSNQSNLMLSTPEETQIRVIQQSYDETVMALPHYQEEYDETVAESLAEEFGPEIATQIVRGQTYTPLLKKQLMKAARQSKQERENLLSTLQSEQEVLHTTQATLEEIDAQLELPPVRLLPELSFDELSKSYNRVKDAEETCETVLQERQQQRIDGHAAVTAPRADIPDLCSYLYESLPVTYPILVDTTMLLERLRRIQQQLAKELGVNSNEKL